MTGAAGATDSATEPKSRVCIEPALSFLMRYALKALAIGTRRQRSFGILNIRGTRPVAPLLHDDPCSALGLPPSHRAYSLQRHASAC